MENYELYHHGVKGMKWGVRRYQNPDGTLTPAGKKRVSKQYKKAVDEATSKLSKNYTRMYVDAHNKVADYMNKGGINRYNAAKQKEYGDNYMDRDDYMADYEKLCDELMAKNLNKSLNEFYASDASVRKARDLVKQYDMTKWNDLAKNNEAAIEEVRRAVEAYDD